MTDLDEVRSAIAFENNLSAPEVAELARHANAKVTLTVYAGLTDGGRERASREARPGRLRGLTARVRRVRFVRY